MIFSNMRLLWSLYLLEESPPIFVMGTGRIPRWRRFDMSFLCCREDIDDHLLAHLTVLVVCFSTDVPLLARSCKVDHIIPSGYWLEPHLLEAHCMLGSLVHLLWRCCAFPSHTWRLQHKTRELFKALQIYSYSMLCTWCKMMKKTWIVCAKIWIYLVCLQPCNTFWLRHWLMLAISLTDCRRLR